MSFGSKVRLSLLAQSRIWTLITACAILGFTTSGCDKVPDIPTAGELLGNNEETQDPAAPANTAPVTQQPVTPTEPVVPAGPTPQQIVEQFTSLSPEQISDGALAQLASSPEAAARITDIDMRGAQVSAKGLGYLSKLPNLESLDISNSRIAADSLAAIGQSPSLKSINLANSDTNDRVISELSRIPHMQTLDLSGTQVTGGSATAFGAMQELTELNLNGTAADDQVVASLVSLPIRKLGLSKSRITSTAIPLILKITTLEDLDISFCGSVSGDAFKGFGRSNIKNLNVSQTGFGVEGFAAIKGMKSLEHLNVYSVGLLQHRAANVFKSFPNLISVNAGKNAIGDPGIEVFFKGHKTLEQLLLHQNKAITDNGLRHLIGVKTLKLLDVNETSCGAAGGQALKQHLPECSIRTSGGTF